jgi:hypothetical protein
MECRHDFTGTAKMSVCGCSTQNGVTHEIGETYVAEDGKYSEYCSKEEANSCSSMTVGCVYNGQKLNDGDRYFKDNVIYQCEIRQDSHAHKVAGCVQIDKTGNFFERLVNCRWYNEVGRHEYEVTCKMDEGGEDFCYVRPEACIYMKNGKAMLYLLPDTYTIYQSLTSDANLGILCKRVSKSELRIEEFSPEQVVTRAHGLKYDAPRGK